MPQMAPLNWLNLFIMVIIMMNIISMFNYYLFMKNPMKKKLLFSINNLWKW
uniref:ATP synthase F0 subunit 8 n=1 Tax=Cassida circumdata TaxID=111203 RepID=A0A343L7Q6_9CUCU|nr:ATP synthase F0 subunit 8 [Cassida circumdata]